MRRTGPSVLVRGGASLVVVAAGIVVAVTRGDSPIDTATTFLVNAKDASIVSASGSSRPATSGEAITSGEVVTTGARGYAQLLTRGRVVLLSDDAALEVVNGEHQQLRSGTAVVNALEGPGLMLDLAGDSVSVPGGSATEASRGVSVRVGSLSGPAAITSTSGRRLAVPRLSQAVLSGDALPSVTTPLHLTDSNDEAAVVPRLVSDDLALKALARGIDTTGRSTAQVIDASWTGTRQPVPDSHSRSERVLPVLIADATHVGSKQQRYDDAVAWRAEGGSWGVVLHLLDGEATAVESTLATLQQATQPAGQVGTVVTQPIGVVTGNPGAGTGPTAIKTPPVIGGNTTFPTAPPSTGNPPSTGVPPTQPPNLLGGLVSTLRSVIDGLFNLLPHDSTAATDTAKSTHSSGVASTVKSTKSASSDGSTKTATHHAPKQAPLTTPTSTSSNGLLGNLLGALLGQH
jgi:hypothetical protein